MMRLRAAAERARTLSPPAADSLLAIVLSAAAAAEIAARSLDHRGVTIAAALVAAGSVAWRRRAPLGAIGVVALVSIAQQAAGGRRIAREVHDVIAHSVSLMVVQAGAAEDVLDRDHRRAREPLRSIQETGRQSIAELSRVLAMLRHGEGREPLGPQPGLASLDSLLDQVREAGLVVNPRVEGEVRTLPPGVDLTAYRIVQEALTNTLKHAGPVGADVVVRYSDRSVELMIRDEGGNGAGGSNVSTVADGSGTGQGLIGMRERVALYGGAFNAGRADGDGYRVDVSLPTGTVPS